MKTYIAVYTSVEGNTFTGYYNAASKKIAKAMAETHCIGIWISVRVSKHPNNLILK